jgi:hypothetical protein
MLPAAGGPPQSLSAPVAFPKPGKEEKRRQATALQSARRGRRALRREEKSAGLKAAATSARRG